MDQWRRASGPDVTNIVNMAQSLYQCEIDNIFTPDVLAMSRNVTEAVVRQFYNPNAEYLSVLYDGDKLLAYTWASRNNRCVWSDDEILEIKIAHVDLSLPVRRRFEILGQMIEQWDLFAQYNHIPIISSSSVRKSQDSFLRLHERYGYQVRGSLATKRITW